MTMVLMTVLIDDPAEYQIMICLMTVLFRMDDPQHVATAPLATVFTEAFRFGSMLPLDHNTMAVDHKNKWHMADVSLLTLPAGSGK